MAPCPTCAVERPDDAAPCPHCGGPAAEGAPDASRARCDDDLIGREVLGRYRIVRLLAEGGMGRVYLAEQTVGTAVRRVAVKVVRPQLGPDRQLVTRFAREAETLVKLTHPNTVQLFDFGALPDGTLALAMEYVEGRSLAVELARGKLAPARAEAILAQICGALREAHEAGIVHRDLKPDNVLLVARAGHPDFVKVVDFGIAKVAGADELPSSKLTQQGMMIGTPPYMSPEQFSGGVIDARADIYALGLIAYEMLTGDLPFSAKTPWEWASKHLTAEPRPLTGAGLSQGHAAAIRSALAKTPADRPASVADFLSAFQSATADAASSCAPGDAQGPALAGATTDSLSLPRAPRLRMFALAGALFALLIAGLAIALLGSPSFEPAARSPLLPDASMAGSRAQPPAASTADAPQRQPRAISDAHRSPPGDLEGVASGQDPKQPPSVMSGRLEPRRPAARRPHGAALPSATAPAAAVAVQAEPRAPEAPVTPPTSPLASRRGARVEAASPSDDPDLSARISRIRAALPDHVEQAVGLFQAAAAKFHDHPALHPPRAELARVGAARARALVSAGRCAQAAALQRALASISAAPSGPDAVGPCPPR